MKNTKLIILDGIPGSGKTTLAKKIASRLDNLNISNRFYSELEPNHPLFIHERRFSSFQIQEEVDYYINRMVELYSNFVSNHKNKEDIVIIESVLFQDNISFAYNLMMDHSKIIDLANKLINVLSELQPSLIYFYQPDVERNWKFISEVRGPDWLPSLRTDEGLARAVRDWTPNQEFIRLIIENWDVKKLIIQNNDYLWEKYTQETMDFLGLLKKPDNFT
jgi:Deoxynucleoside kinases